MQVSIQYIDLDALLPGWAIRLSRHVRGEHASVELLDYGCPEPRIARELPSLEAALRGGVRDLASLKALGVEAATVRIESNCEMMQPADVLSILREEGFPFEGVEVF